METGMEDCQWLRDGGWVRVDEATPPDEILEVVQHVFDHIPSEPMMMSLRGCPWPYGPWHWEPDGHPSSTEPSHYRRLTSASVAISRALSAPTPASE
jgi:hypothetical protein